jgi:hypothetical protein
MVLIDNFRGYERSLPGYAAVPLLVQLRPLILRMLT